MRRAWFAFLGVCVLGAAASAQKVAVDQGWYRSDFFHDPFNTNYIVGDCSSGCGYSEYRQFFVFDLTGVSSTIQRAVLSLELPGGGYNSGDPTETVTYFDYGGSIASLVAGTGGSAAFADLGSGTVYGSLTVGNPTRGRYEIPLDADAVAALNAARGGLFALGGTVTTLDALQNDEYVFGGSGTPARLVLATGGTESYLVVGNGAGPQAFYPGLHPWMTQVGALQDWAVVGVDQFAQFPLPSAKLQSLGTNTTMPTIPGESRFGPRIPIWMDNLFFTVQVVTWDPVLQRPEKTSNGLAVWIKGNGRIVAVPYGSSQGLSVRAETVLDANGLPAVRFPFTTSGH